jgi:1L-myo-inositol 1-phosphate cytidylyltransferase
MQLDAVIIAAGYGSRIRDLSVSKPLTLVAGKTLIELGVRQASAAGAAKVIVVTGHEADRLEACLAELARETGIAIEAARVSDWSKPNGHSVMAGAARADGDFLLMMADHIFSAGILSALARQGGADRGVTLAIDRRITSPLIDPDDATWVETGEGGFIRAIGKTIARYDAADCGAFLATQELAGAIASAIAAGKSGSLSDGMQVLADQGRAATMDIGESWWLDVDDPRAHAEAEAQAPQELPEVFS